MDFVNVHQQLNTAQKEAVTTIEGPLLVIAGPGTGKTQLLSARAAYILEQTDTDPNRILCLTFTDRAATNMKDRMLELIGPEARKIVVKTFHGLGAELINLYPQYFWNAARLQPAPEIVQRQTVENILRTRPLDDPLTLEFAGQYTLVNQILQDIEQAKRAGLNPGQLRAVADANLVYMEAIRGICAEVLAGRIGKQSISEYRRLLDELPDEAYGDYTVPLQSYSQVLKHSLTQAIEQAESENSTKPLTAWKREWSTSQEGQRVLKDEERSRRMRALSDVYDQYQAELHSIGYFDYSDMILEVLDQLQQREDLLTEVQERFSYIMIDEFQDSNDAQFRLAYLLANHPVHEGRPNIMAVGDDDQSIYRFQGAELSNVEAFTSAFSGTKEVVLTDNYRSHQSVLDMAGKVANMIDYRLANIREHLDKNITARNSGIPQGEIRHLQYPDQAQQLSGAADEIEQAVKEKAGSIAVIARSHRSLERLAGALHHRQVPLRYERSSNILEHPIIELIADLSELIESLAYGDEEQADALAGQLIVHPVWNIETVKAYQFAVSMRHQPGWAPAMKADSNPGLAKTATAWFELSRLSRELPAAMMLEYLLGLRSLPSGYTSPVREYYLSGEQDMVYMEALMAIQRLRGLTEEFSRKQQPKLADLVEFLRLNQRHGVIIPEQSTFLGGEQPVELLSAHGAKGLEFDQVFIVDALHSEWSPRGPRQRPPANLAGMQPYGEHDDDYGRLMFVAMTRARSGLTVTSYAQSETGKQVLPTPYIRHLKSRELQAADDALTIVERAVSWPRLNTSDLRNLLSPLLEDYQLSVTHILNFLDVDSGGPQYFTERNLLRLPDVKSPYMAYGSAIHAGLEAAHRDVNRGNLDMKAVLDAFEQQLEREQIIPKEAVRYRQQGRQLLQELLEQQRLLLLPGDQPERVINHVRIGEATIGGKLDVVRRGEDGLRIIDYKTGKAPVNLQTTSKSEGKKARQHRLQLIFYVLLAREAGLAEGQDTAIGEMIYVESRVPKRFSQEYQPGPEDIEHMHRLIQSIWRSVQSLDFPDVGQYPADLDGMMAFERDLIRMHDQ